MRFIRSFLTVAAVAVFAATAPAASTPLPAKPADYVLDEVGVFSPQRREALARVLEQYERETSNQVWVCVLPRVPNDYAVEDFTQRTAEAWGVGRKDRENGLVLFVFPESRTTRVEVGYGLEGAVPDGLANIIIQDDIIPSFRA
ncbi:MAG: TPM domain-containing protein, partial [Chthoniobacterales bacterium]